MLAKSELKYFYLAVLAILPYLTGLNHAFVYDDHGVIEENTFLEKPSNFLRVITLQTLGDPDVIDGQRPVVVASYFVDRMIWELRPFGYRITNFLLHGLVTVLLFFILRRLSSPLLAGTVALLFSWHPLLVEAVHAPSFREDLLYVAFGLIYLLVGTKPRIAVSDWLCGMTALALAMLSKEAAVVFPVLLTAVWWLFPYQRPEKKTVIAWLIVSGVLVAGLACLVLGGRPVQALGRTWNGISLQGDEGVWSAPWLAVCMLRKLVVPYPLSVDYVITPVKEMMDVRWWLGMVALVAGAGVAWRERERSPLITFIR